MLYVFCMVTIAISALCVSHNHHYLNCLKNTTQCFNAGGPLVWLVISKSQPEYNLSKQRTIDVLIRFDYWTRFLSPINNMNSYNAIQSRLQFR